MRLLDLTLPTAAENVALDEALLDQAEAQGGEVLRLWEPDSPLVVVGRASRVEQEVDLPRCRADGVPILRRTSGGAAVVAGPGCLMYAVVLSYELRPDLRLIDQAHCFVLAQIIQALERASVGATCQGTSDITIDGRKISGNSLRCKRSHLLYHGTLLYEFPLPLISRYLKHPPRQPAYRRDRQHDQFVRNLDVTAERLRRGLVEQWRPQGEVEDWPREGVRQIVAERYQQDTWNLRL